MGLNLKIEMKYVYQDCVAELGLNMHTRAGIKHVYQSWD
jgi:hypothetical protein